MMTRLPRLLIAPVILLIVGCAGGVGAFSRHNPETASSESCIRPQIERGERRPIIDTAGWVIGIPSKIILWDRRIDNHNISADTESAIAQYVNDLELGETKVRINQYAPVDEWRRLKANTSVAWGWRYTLGALTWAEEAIFPGRIFGSDHFNPYTNTISIYSDAPAVAVKEGGRARDIRSRPFPGTYAAVNSLPLVSMWHETVATGYAFQYLHESLPDLEPEGYHLLYPAWGAHLGGDIASFTAVPTTFGAAIGAIPGHIIGRYRGRSNDETETARAQQEEPSDD